MYMHVSMYVRNQGSAGRKPVVVVLHGTLKCKEDDGERQIFVEMKNLFI